MKFYILILLFLVFSVHQSQAQKYNFKFQVNEYIGDKPYRQTIQNIDSNSKMIDLYFLKKHFYKPYYLPESFINREFKNQTVIIWKDENGEKDFMKNWSNSYSYDSLSRIISYSYSSCIICSNMAYNYRVTYNDKSQPIEIKNIINDKYTFKMEYNDEGNIVKMSYYNFDKLNYEIKLLN